LFVLGESPAGPRPGQTRVE